MGIVSASTLTPQTITFTTNAPPSAAYHSSFTVGVHRRRSGNPVIFTSSGACSNSGATYAMTSVTGTCSVIANQAGDYTNYLQAAQVTQTVNTIPPTFAFAGVQTTLTANGLSGAFGVALDAAGDIFISDAYHNQVVEVPANQSGQTTVVSGLKLPYGLAVDGAGNLFIADAQANQVVKIPAGGGLPTTVNADLSYPTAVALDAAGDIFIADANNNRVVKIPSGGGQQITVASGLSGPSGVAVDGAGNLFIGDYYNNQVVKVPAGGGAQTTVGSATEGPDRRGGGWSRKCLHRWTSATTAW